MARVDVNWFEFAGVSSATMGVKLLEFPNRRRAAYRKTPTPVPGRSGNLWYGSDSYDDVDLEFRVQLKSTASRNLIAAWLKGYGLLRFSDQPTLAYHARIYNAFEMGRVSGQLGSEIVPLVFTCHPFPYVYPEPAALVIDVAGTGATTGTITNAGTHKAEPTIKVTGYGDMYIEFGTQTLYIDGLGTLTSGGHTSQTIVINTEAGVAYDNANINTNLCLLVTYEHKIELPPGAVALAWGALPNDDELTGAITTIEISKPWRYL